MPVRPLAAALLSGAVALTALVLPGSPVEAAAPPAAKAEIPRVLVWGGSYGFRHPSITNGELAFVQLAQETGAFTATVTENPLDLSMATLKDYDVLAWVSTTGKPPITQAQRDEVIRWSQCGGGNIGFHAALDADYGWAEHAELFGAQFDSHPKGAGSGEARMIVEDRTDPILAGWKDVDSFMLDDEYYRWRTAKRVPGISLPRNAPGTDVLLSLDESTVGGDIQTGPLAYEHHQPIAWKKTFRDGGRVVYNNMGHSDTTWSLAPFRTFITGSVDWISQKRPDAACLAGTGDVSTRLTPPAADPATVGKPCPVPVLRERNGTTWEVSGPARAVSDSDAQPLAAGVPGNLSWGAQTWVVDLSKSNAATADVTVDLSWLVPTDDYDLSVTTGWGVYASHALPGASAEQLVLKDVPHCAIINVAGDNLYATSQQGPTAALKVVANAAAAPVVVPPAAPPAAAPAPGTGTGTLAATGGRTGLAVLAVGLMLTAALVRRTRAA